MTFKKLLLATATTSALLASFNANAVAFGTPVTDDTFQDFAVKVISHPNGSTRHCSGMLVGGRYVITAAHCMFYNRDAENSGMDYNTGEMPADMAESITVLYGNQDYYEGNTVGVSKAVVNRFYQDSRPYADAQVQSDYKAAIDAFQLAVMTEEEWLGADHQWDFLASDLAILTLAEPVSQSTSLPFGWNVFYDRDIEGENLSLIGWGRNEDDVLPAVANFAHVTTLLSPYSDSDGYNHLKTSMGIFDLESTDGQSAICGGDSGGVLYHNGLAVGAARMAQSCTNYVENPTRVGSNITAYAFHQDWIIEQMNILAYATEVSYTGVDVFTQTVQVQNLTAEDALLTPTLMDETGLYEM